MQAKHQRKISSGKEYDYLFPKAKGEEITIKWDANVFDTLDFIPKMVMKTKSDTAELAKILKGASLYETCHNIWDFVYNHIQYHYDEEGTEQVRRPARTWMDRVRGVDCDCYTVFISSVLTNLHIPHTYRITKYKNKENYQHIYPIVPTADGKYITIDCVIDKFNYEEPFTQKKDSPMKLTYLNGIGDTDEPNTLMAIMPISDITHLPDFQDFDGVGKLEIGKKLKDIAHIANRANPATTLLRVGVLASMKLNLFEIPKNLRYAYLTDAQAEAKNINLDKLHKLQTILKKMEDIFYGAGGKPENLKKAIINGKGNKDKSVSGVDDYDENTPLKELLSSIYDEEYADAIKEVSGLGDPATGTAIAAATSVMAVIAGIIKKLGIITNGGAHTSSTTTTATTTTTTDGTNDPNQQQQQMQMQQQQQPPATTDIIGAPKPNDFTQKMKDFIKGHEKVIVVGGFIAVSVVVIGVLHHHHKTHHPKVVALSGVPSRKKRRGKKNKQKKAPIALL